MKKFDLIFKNSGKASATKTIQTALGISRTNARYSTDANIPALMSQEGSALAKNSAPRNAFDVPYLDDPKTKFAVSDRDVETWRRFRPGDDPESASSEEEEPEEEEFDEDEEEEVTAENERLARSTNGAFDKQRLYRAIDRLVRKTQKRLRKVGRGHDGRSYARDDGRSYTTTHGCIGGIDEWNQLFRQGEIS